jgi:hypothetical protein
VLLLGTGTHAFEDGGVVAADGDEEIGAEEEIDVVELEFAWLCMCFSTVKM